MRRRHLGPEHELRVVTVDPEDVGDDPQRQGPVMPRRPKRRQAAAMLRRPIAPVLDQDNVVVNYVAIKEDITSRREVESQLRKLSRAVEQSGNTVIIMDRNGLIEYVNPKFTEVTGYSPEEAAGKSPIALMQQVEEIPDFREDDWWLTVNNGQIWQGEFRNHRKDG